MTTPENDAGQAVRSNPLLAKHDQVCSRCTHPAVGHVVRVGRDWVDVEWHAGIGCHYRGRARKTDVIKLAEHLTMLAEQGLARFAESYMYRKSRRAMILERKRKQAAVMRAAKARKRIATPVEPWTFCGVVRAAGPMFGQDVRQMVITSDGDRVCVDGLRVRTLRGFRAAMARKLWASLGRGNPIPAASCPSGDLAVSLPRR